MGKAVLDSKNSMIFQLLDSKIRQWVLLSEVTPFDPAMPFTVSSAERVAGR